VSTVPDPAPEPRPPEATPLGPPTAHPEATPLGSPSPTASPTTESQSEPARQPANPLSRPSPEDRPATEPKPAAPKEEEPLGVVGWIMAILALAVVVLGFLAWFIGPVYLFKGLVAISADRPWLFWGGLPVLALLCLLGWLLMQVKK
jgi:hypothetical protein